MSDICVNPLDPVRHDGPGGDQFCIFCLRKRGDDALQALARIAEIEPCPCPCCGDHEAVQIAKEALP